jgi:hypothetical protein
LILLAKTPLTEFYFLVMSPVFVRCSGNFVRCNTGDKRVSYLRPNNRLVVAVTGFAKKRRFVQGFVPNPNSGNTPIFAQNVV